MMGNAFDKADKTGITEEKGDKMDFFLRVEVACVGI